MLASAGSKGGPMATPSICWHITLLKLNSKDLVVVCISLKKTKRGKDGAIRSLL